MNGTGGRPGTGRPIGGSQVPRCFPGGGPARVEWLQSRTGRDPTGRGGGHVRRFESALHPEAGAIASIAFLPGCLTERGGWTPSGGKEHGIARTITSHLIIATRRGKPGGGLHRGGATGRAGFP